MVCFADERKWGDKYHKDRLGFNNLISHLDFIDLPISNQLYNWSNMRIRSSLGRLGRVFISDTWEMYFPNVWAQIVP